MTGGRAGRVFSRESDLLGARIGKNRKLQGELNALRAALQGRRLSATSRGERQRRLVEKQAALRQALAAIPFRPALADEMVAELDGMSQQLRAPTPPGRPSTEFRALKSE